MWDVAKAPDGRWAVIAGRPGRDKATGKRLWMEMANERFATREEAAREMRRLAAIPTFSAEGL